jgi:hypothetical protein
LKTVLLLGATCCLAFLALDIKFLNQKIRVITSYTVSFRINILNKELGLSMRRHTGKPSLIDLFRLKYPPKEVALRRVSKTPGKFPSKERHGLPAILMLMKKMRRCFSTTAAQNAAIEICNCLYAY